MTKHMHISTWSSVMLLLSVGGCSEQNRSSNSGGASTRVEFTDEDIARRSSMPAPLVSEEDERGQASAPSSASPQLRTNMVPDNVEGALAFIQRAGHSCDAVSGIEVFTDSAVATCSDGERYRLGVMNHNGGTQELAMKCSAMAKLGIEGC